MKTRNWEHLLPAQSEGVLCSLMPLWYKKDLIFIRNGASLTENSLRSAARTSPFLNRLNSPHDLSTRSWTLTGDTWPTPDSDMGHLWSETLLFIGLTLGPVLGLVQFVLPPLGWLGPLLGSVCPSVWDSLAPSEICLLHLIPIYIHISNVLYLLFYCW